MSNSKPEIFISYAWGSDDTKQDKLRSAFNEQLFALLRDRKFNLVLDRDALTYKSSISSFMKRIGAGNFIIVVLSDKYLKSKYCMYELLTITKANDFKERIFPVVLADVKIDDPIEKLEYHEYWDGEAKKLNKKLKQVDDLSYIGPIQEELKEYAEYKRMIAEFLTITADMIITRVSSGNKYNFDGLLQSLQKAVAAHEAGVQDEMVHEVTTDYNKRLQTAPASKKLQQQEYFTRMHLKNFNLPLPALKQMLYLLKYMEGFEKDDLFDEKIATAVANFQSAEGLSPVDGIFGPDSYKALINAAKKAGYL